VRGMPPAMTIAVIAAICVVLLILALLAPRLSRGAGEAAAPAGRRNRDRPSM
jgi:hypothetical protein